MSNTPEKPDDESGPAPRVSSSFLVLRDLNRSLLDFQKLYHPPDFAFAQISPIYAQLTRITDTFRQSHISSVLGEQQRFSDSIAASVRSANEALTGISSNFAQIANLSKTMEELSRPWRTSLLQVGDQMRQLLRPVDLFARKFSETMRISIAAEAAFSRFHGRSLGDLVGVTPMVSRAVFSSVMAVSTAYADLAKRLSIDQDGIIVLFPVVLDYPPLELFNIIDIAQSVTEVEPEPEVEQVEADIRRSVAEHVPLALESALATVNPELRRLWEGAKSALVSTNPDRPRHVATSLRELMTHVLHILSPDDDVKRWSSDPSHYHNNKPTRRARLLYICRGINHAEFTDFVKKDIDAILALIDLFQQGTHDIALSFTEAQLEAMLHGTETAVLFLVNISRSQ